MSVNKTLSSKLLIIEKALTDERRVRRDLEIRIRTRKQEGSRGHDSQINGGYQNGTQNVEDLAFM